MALLHPLTASSSPSADDLSEFLKTHMLGLIAHINDILQDFRGKKPVAFKQKVLRSLGELVKQASDSVSSAAPQVGLSCSLISLTDILLDYGNVSDHGSDKGAVRNNTVNMV